MDANGSFTVKNLREMLDRRLLDTHEGVGTTHWCSLVPKKVNVFIWRLCRGGILVKEMLYERTLDSVLNATVRLKLLIIAFWSARSVCRIYSNVRWNQLAKYLLCTLASISTPSKSKVPCNVRQDVEQQNKKQDALPIKMKGRKGNKNSVHLPHQRKGVMLAMNFLMSYQIPILLKRWKLIDQLEQPTGYQLYFVVLDPREVLEWQQELLDLMTLDLFY
ncbi:hypothetical protein Ccrd_004435, partial [Cynara cardunculus var. scolymus]